MWTCKQLVRQCLSSLEVLDTFTAQQVLGKPTFPLQCCDAGHGAWHAWQKASSASSAALQQAKRSLTDWLSSEWCWCFKWQA